MALYFPIGAKVKLNKPNAAHHKQIATVTDTRVDEYSKGYELEFEDGEKMWFNSIYVEGLDSDYLITIDEFNRCVRKPGFKDISYKIKPDETSEVDHPSHYNQGSIECIDAMKSAYGLSDTLAFCKLNAFKYIWRCEEKGKEKEDLEKAVWYLNKAIDILEEIASQ